MYVKLLLLFLKEKLQLLGCETGTYGINCSRTCSHCKNSATCNIETGECDVLGCALTGFKPPLCIGNYLWTPLSFCLFLKSFQVNDFVIKTF